MKVIKVIKEIKVMKEVKVMKGLIAWGAMKEMKESWVSLGHLLKGFRNDEFVSPPYLSHSLHNLFFSFQFILFLFFISSVFPIAYAFPAFNSLPSPTSPSLASYFCTVSINANGMSNPK
jgi:hypothetical protein